MNITLLHLRKRIWILVFNGTFSNISTISWRVWQAKNQQLLWQWLWKSV